MKPKVKKLKAEPDGTTYTNGILTRTGHVYCITQRTKLPKPNTTRKIDRDTYLNTKTGELLPYDHSATSRAENTSALRETFARLRDIINSNTDNPERVHWITLTYRDNMTDTDRLYEDFNRFRRRLYRHAERIGRQPPEYITVIEPQARGAWHMHLILIWQDGDAPYLDNNGTVAPMWGQGYTKTQIPRECDNLGAYLTAYLTDMPMEFDSDGTEPTQSPVESPTEPESHEGHTDAPTEPESLTEPTESPTERITGASVDRCAVDRRTVTPPPRKDKSILKGQRLHLYPKGVNLYRTSRGIKQPTAERLNTGALIDIARQRNKVGAPTPTYTQVFEIAYTDTDTVIVRKDYYNTRRAVCQEDGANDTK